MNIHSYQRACHSSHSEESRQPTAPPGPGEILSAAKNDMSETAFHSTREARDLKTRRMTNRTALYLLLLLALLAWGGLLLFTRFIPPDSTLAFVIFFLILGIALTCTIAPLAYAFSGRFLTVRQYRPNVRHALRQGALLALCAVLNLLLLALHSWNIFAAIVIFVAVVVIEVLSLARKW